MIATKVKIQNIWCQIYKPTIASDKWVICLHGLGEKGNADGSQLDLVNVHGYPAKAKAGFEFPFNIIAPQIHTGQYMDYWQLTSQNGVNNSWFVNHVKEVLGASEIIVTGLSLGGRGTWLLLAYDNKQYIKAIAPICGWYDFTSTNIDIKNLRSVPGYSWHHINDTVMSYKADLGDPEPNPWGKTGITRYNYYGDRPTQMIDGVSRPCHYLNTLTTTGVNAHADAYNKAYDITVGKDSLLTWIKQNFAPALPPPQPVKDPIVEIYILDGKLTFKSQSGITIQL